MTAAPVRVLVVDDSALVRDILRSGLSGDGIEVVDTARNVYEARDRIVQLDPDVVTLDVEMPRMDGVSFLKRLMPQYPVPVVMVSAMTGPGALVTLEALEHGAVDFVLKPSSIGGAGLREMLAELRGKVQTASRVPRVLLQSRGRAAARMASSGGGMNAPARGAGRSWDTTDKIIALGASTGGTVALRSILAELPPDAPGTVVVQHMPPRFTAMFAEKLDELCAVQVREARNGDRVVTGTVLIAPGGMHMRIVRVGGRYEVRLAVEDSVNGHMPSVDVMFDSLADCAGPNTVAAVLTGMGADGADGILRLREAGARTFAQDEASSVVFGMPREAHRRGGAETLVPVDRVAATLMRLVGEVRR